MYVLHLEGARAGRAVNRIPYFWVTPDTDEAVCDPCAQRLEPFHDVAGLEPRYATPTSRLCVRCLGTLGPINAKEGRGE